MSIEALAEFMGGIREAMDAMYEAQQVEQVFGLTGGELDTDLLEFKAPSKFNGIVDRQWRYSYDGVPEWAGSDFKDKFWPGVDYFTLVEFGISYESSAPEEMTFSDGKRYFRVRDYLSSGETECPEGPHGGDEKVGEGRTEGFERCPLCEADKGEEHGYIYLGNGLETVYKHVEFDCKECGLTRDDIEEPQTGDLCGCAFDSE